MHEDYAFYRWPSSPVPQPAPVVEVSHKPLFGEGLHQTVSGQEVLFDHSVGAPATAIAREIARLRAETDLEASMASRIGAASLNGANGDKQLALLSDDEAAMQTQRLGLAPLKKPRGRTSARNIANGDAARTGAFGEQ